MRKHEFTVLELLLVLGLSAAMLTIAVPAFYRTMRGSATGNAARELMGKISAARAYAATNRTDVAIVFPQKKSNTKVSAVLKYSTYRVCEVDKDGTNTFKFRRWVPGENWTYLPTGVVIGVDKNGDDAKFQGIDTDDKITDVPMNLQDSSDVEEIGNFIVFRMDGMLYKLQEVQLRLKQGLVTIKADNKVEIKLTGTDQDKKDYLPLTVQFNGKVKLSRELVSE